MTDKIPTLDELIEKYPVKPAIEIKEVHLENETEEEKADQLANLLPF